MKASSITFWTGATILVLVMTMSGLTWSFFVYVGIVGLFIYFNRKRKQKRDTLFKEADFKPTHSYKYSGTEIGIEMRTKRLALMDGDVMQIFSSSEIIKCKASKKTLTVRPDIFDKDKKVRETTYFLDVWTNSIDTPNFRLEFMHSHEQEEWRARINAICLHDA